VRHRKRDATLLACCFLLLLGEAAVFLAQAQRIRKGYPDFAIFYAGANILRAGLGHRLYDFGLQQTFTRQFSARSQALSFNHPPYELLPFLPFTLLSYVGAYWAWAAINLLLVFWIARLLQPYAKNLAGEAPLALVLLIFPPIFFAIVQGQDSVVLLLLYTFAFVFLKRQRGGLAGAALGLGLFKFQLVVPFFAGPLLKKRWRLLVAFAVTGAILVLLSLYLVGLRGALDYANLLLAQNRGLASANTQAQWNIYPARMLSLRAALEALLLGKVREVYLDAGVLLGSIALLVWAGSQWVENAEDAAFNFAFSLSVAVTLLVSYHLYVHDASLLALPVLLVGDSLMASGKSWVERGLSLLILLFFLFPLYLALIKLQMLYLMSFAILGFALLVHFELSGRGRILPRRAGTGRP
jgi:Glycosyltransferase family 87